MEPMRLVIIITLEPEVKLGSKILVNLSNPRYDWHCMIFEAVSSKGLHQWLAERCWLFQASDEQNEEKWLSIYRVLAPKELDSFLSGEVAQKSGVGRKRLIEILSREFSELYG